MSDLNSNEYLEMCNQLHEKFKKVEEREKKAFRMVSIMKRDIAGIYGLVRAMDNYLIGACDLPDDLQTTIELLISSVKDAADQHLFSDLCSPDVEIFTFMVPLSSHTGPAASVSVPPPSQEHPASPPVPNPPLTI